MTDEKHEHTEDESLDEAELARDLEIKDAEETDAITGGVTQKIGPGITWDK